MFKPQETLNLLGVFVGVEVNNKSLESVSAARQADTKQTVLVGSAVASDEIAAKSVAEKHGVEFIRLSETNLFSQVVRLLPQWLVTQHNVIAVKFEADGGYMTKPADSNKFIEKFDGINRCWTLSELPDRN